MNFIQTLYLNKNKSPYTNSYGWVAPQYHLMSWALSCLQLHKFYGKAELYANTDAAELLIDRLQLPYHTVHLSHDNFALPDEHLWALPKILTYSLQNQPFLHLDGDVFLFNHFNKELLASELIAQNLEAASDYYLRAQKELTTHFTYFPECVRRDFDDPQPIQAVNAGILGGHNIEFIREYTSLAFKYVQRNSHHLKKINADRFNVFFEQHLFYSFAKEKKAAIGLLFEDVITDNEYKYLGDFHDAPCYKNYLHLLGHFKRDEFTCIQMAAKLRELYPDQYYRIVSLCRQERVPLPVSIYSITEKPSFEWLLNQNLQAKAIYLAGNHRSNIEAYTSNQTESLLIPDLQILKEKYAGNYLAENHLAAFETDFAIFSGHLTARLEKIETISTAYLYGRDLFAVNWFCNIFGDQDIENKIIERCEMVDIISSVFDWAGMLNKSQRVGVQYYDELELAPGHFFNLVVPETTAQKISLFDIDESEKLLLDALNEPMAIKMLLLKMQSYAEDDILANHIETYNEFLIKVIKQLTIKKAIKPFEKPQTN